MQTIFSEMSEGSTHTEQHPEEEVSEKKSGGNKNKTKESVVRTMKFAWCCSRYYWLLELENPIPLMPTNGIRP